MMDLLTLDEQLFHWINSGWSNGFFDAIVPYWRHKLLWLPLYFFIVSFILINFKKKGIIMILAILLTGGVADIASSHIIKKNVERLRPCNDPDVRSEMTLRARCGRGYSFTSSHATNHFAIASIIVLLLGGIWKWIRWPLFIWAGTIAIGQVYVGVHYPIDILCGAILGYFCGRLVYYLYERIPETFLSNIGAI